MPKEINKVHGSMPSVRPVQNLSTSLETIPRGIVQYKDNDELQ